MNTRHELDGFVYLGWYRWRFEKRTHCKVCRALAVGFCLVYGRGEPLILVLCAKCGKRADDDLYQPNAVGIRRRLTGEQRRAIALAEGSPPQVAARFTVSRTAVHRVRRIHGRPT